jgi:hypothetical protein
MGLGKEVGHCAFTCLSRLAPRSAYIHAIRTPRGLSFSLDEFRVEDGFTEFVLLVTDSASHCQHYRAEDDRRRTARSWGWGRKWRRSPPRPERTRPSSLVADGGSLPNPATGCKSPPIDSPSLSLSLPLHFASTPNHQTRTTSQKGNQS